MTIHGLIEAKIPDILKAYRADLRAGSIQPAKSGYNNPVFIVETSGGPDLVLRVIHSTESWKVHKEAAVYRLFEQQQIPTARILKVDSSRTLIPYDYMISEKLAGSSLSSQWEALSPKDLLSIYAELGDCLARIHSVPFDRFGDVQPAGGGFSAGPAYELAGFDPGPFSQWKRMFIEIIRARLQSLKGTAFDELRPQVLRYFQDNIGLIDYPIVPRLLHLDLHGGNVFVEQDHVTGILDVEEALIGHNEYDLMRTELGNFDETTPDRREAFFAAYTRRIPLDPGCEQRRPFYRLSRTLVQARCLVQFKDAYSADLARDVKETREEILHLIA